MKTLITRDEAIQKLIANEVETVINSYQDYNDTTYIDAIFSSGFKGYLNYTDEGLELELTEQFSNEYKVIPE